MLAGSDHSAPLNHVFVDFENVQQIDHSLIGVKTVVFTLFIGANQTKLDTALVEKLIAHAASVELVRVTTTKKNALDLVLAYHVGRAALEHPSARFHIVSRDKDYDALVTYLRSRRVSVHRHVDCSTLSFGALRPATQSSRKNSPAEASEAITEWFDRTVEQLRKNGANRPKKKKGLLGTLKNYLGKDADEKAKEELLDQLIKAGHVTIEENNGVTYHF